jgi:predicted adenine nucleotide alpha hydrolase (AANH) superfamily ATPase
VLRDKINGEVVMFFSNSNIDTLEEFEKRKASAQVLAEAEGVELVVDDYNHEDWLKSVADGFENEPEKGERCSRCYAYNMRRTAEYAATNGLDSYTTSLSVSPHKPSAKIFAAAENISCASFMKVDFKKRGGFLLSLKKAKELGLYRQNYCGCEFSKN